MVPVCMKLARFVMLAALLGTAGGALSACNTIEGLGKDVAAVGKATSGAAQTTREEIDKATGSP